MKLVSQKRKQFLCEIATFKLAHIGSINRAITSQTWAKANAINTIDVTTRANARANLELIVNTDPSAAAALFARIDTNKKVIDQALDILRPLFLAEDDRVKLRALEDVRGRYVASFQKVGALLRNGERDAARQRLLEETLPLLDGLQDRVIEISRIQSAEMQDAGEATQTVIDNAGTMNLILSAVAIVLGGFFAWKVAKSITVPLAQAVIVAKTMARGDLGQSIHARSGRLSEARDRHHGRDRGGIARTGRRYRTGQPRGVADGRSDPAECRAGRRSRGCRGFDAGPGSCLGKSGWCVPLG